MAIQRRILQNGIRVVVERMPSVRSAGLGVWVNVGSRDESPEEHGVSHFIEHMFFKGTRRRSAKVIAQEVDAMGGDMNAFTSRELTTFYIKVLDEQFSRGAEILADVFRHSRFDPRDIRKEKQVISEEIRMVEDDPEDLVHDLHIGRAWRKDPLGRTILGTQESIASFSRGDLTGYLGKHYRPKNIVIAVAGNVNPENVFRRMDRLFGTIPEQDEITERKQALPADLGVCIRRKSLEQTHLCLGVPGVSITDKRRMAVQLLSVLLGESASSRLFQEVRERRGLAYSIYSHASGFRDTGLFTIYAASRPGQAVVVLKLIASELKRFLRDGVPPEDLRKAKNHLKGSWMLGMESTASRMSKLAKDEIYFGRSVPLKEILDEADRVSKTDLSDAAQSLFGGARLSLTAVGPLTSKNIPDALLSL